MITVERDVHFRRGRSARKKLGNGQPTSETPASRIPRVSRLMALAIQLDKLVRDGEVTNQAELARLGNVSRARLTQIMNLLYLAPDIQEEILSLPTIEFGRNRITDRQLRPIAAITSWDIQRRMWNRHLSAVEVE